MAFSFQWNSKCDKGHSLTTITCLVSAVLVPMILVIQGLCLSSLPLEQHEDVYHFKLCFYPVPTLPWKVSQKHKHNSFSFNPKHSPKATVYIHQAVMFSTACKRRPCNLFWPYYKLHHQNDAASVERHIPFSSGYQKSTTLTAVVEAARHNRVKSWSLRSRQGAGRVLEKLLEVKWETVWGSDPLGLTMEKRKEVFTGRAEMSFG